MSSWGRCAASPPASRPRPWCPTTCSWRGRPHHERAVREEAPTVAPAAGGHRLPGAGGAILAWRFLSDTLVVSAPKCGDKHGQWRVPGNSGVMMRWTENALGGVTLKVDSAVEGNGAVLFADVREKFTWDKSNFLVTNCVGLPRYQVEENIVRTSDEQDVQHPVVWARRGEGDRRGAFFYKYVIRSMNGTKLATTQMLKPATGEVNISLIDAETDDVTDVVATATRRGAWEQRQELGGVHQRPPRLAHHVPGVQGRAEERPGDHAGHSRGGGGDHHSDGGAYRQEFIGENGIPNTGKWHMYWSFGKSILLIFVVIIVTFWRGVGPYRSRRACSTRRSRTTPSSASRAAYCRGTALGSACRSCTRRGTEAMRCMPLRAGRGATASRCVPGEPAVMGRRAERRTLGPQAARSGALSREPRPRPPPSPPPPPPPPPPRACLVWAPSPPRRRAALAARAGRRARPLQPERGEEATGTEDLYN
ncbi:unnamed protein product [Prorocentrum cordatum]|uniref:Amine oxidase n=1 Tax=Prorocentrum cordatum TaxID=2364126 RepID=A0ABN9UA12_9DINO|nr:unnamed protein product [Polarella glacialis]